MSLQIASQVRGRAINVVIPSAIPLQISSSSSSGIRGVEAEFNSSFLGSKISLFARPAALTSAMKSSPQYGGMANGGGWLSKLGLGSFSNRAASAVDDSNSPSLGPDDDAPVAGQRFATFGAGCFWGVELAFQRVSGVSKTEVGYTQGAMHNPTYGDVCSGGTGHSEVVRVQYDPNSCSYGDLLDMFWARHDPTTLNRQGGDVGTQYRSGIYFYSPEQEKEAVESLQKQQLKLNRKIVTEILPAKKFYRAEEYHQQYLAKGGRFGSRQSAEKGCTDPIRCYG